MRLKRLETLRLFSAFRAEIEVVSHEETQEELVKDLIMIVSHFAGSFMGAISIGLLRVSCSSYQVRAYSIKHSHNISEFLEAYRLILQRAIDEI